LVYNVINLSQINNKISFIFLIYSYLLGPTILIPDEIISNPNLFISANGVCQALMTFLLNNFGALGLCSGILQLPIKREIKFISE
jgi:hypothetical protein